MADETFFIDRRELERVFDMRSARNFEDLQRRVSETEAATTANVDATTGLTEASFVTLSPNAELPNEFVLSVGPGMSLEAGSGGVTLLSFAPQVPNGHSVNFITTGNTQLVLPISGTVVTREGAATLSNKTLAAPLMAGLGNYLDDAAASAGGVPVGGVYRNGSVLMVRVS